MCRSGSRDRIVVSTLRCGRNNPGSNPGHGTLRNFFPISGFFFFLSFYFLFIFYNWSVQFTFVTYDPFCYSLLSSRIVPFGFFFIYSLFVCPSHRNYYFKISL